MPTLQEQFGGLDIYLFDQLVRGNVSKGMTIFDAGCWRTLKPGGLFFCRLASTIGAERLVRPLHGRWNAMADGSERYLVDGAMLMQVTNALGA
jgi:hypothetical protein